MSRRNRLLGVAFVLCLGLALGLEQPWRGDAIARTEAAVGKLFPRLARELERIAQVEISTPAGPAVTLNRQGPGFVVEQKMNHPADDLRLRQLLTALGQIDSAEVVSTNPLKRGVFGVDDATGTRIVASDENGGVLADLVAGKLRRQDPNQVAQVRLEFYVRPAGRDEVFLVKELAAPAVEPERWLTRRFFAVEMADLKRLERRDLEGGETESWALERVAAEDDPATEEVEDHAWMMVAPQAIRAALFAGDSWAFSFAGLGPADVVAAAGRKEVEKPEYGFSTNAYRAVAADGREFVLYLGRPAGGDRRYAWAPDRPWIYTIPEHDAIQLRVPVERMLSDD